jgi:ferredoxin-NADP reductase/fatty acid desaturase
MPRTPFPTADLAILEQVVSEPRFRGLTTVPRFAVAEIGIVAASYATLVVGSASWLSGVVPYPVVLLLHTLAIYAIFTPLHDATHRSASSDPVVNDWIGNLAALPLLPGFTTKLYRYLHLEHHRYTGEKDRDPDDAFVSRSPAWRALTWAFIDVHWALFYLRRRRERPVEEQRKFFASLAFFVAWHVAGLTSPWPLEFVLLWLIPQRLGVTLLAYLFAAIQHPDEVEQRERPIQATRMIKGGAPMRWFLLGQSEHLMHHLFPSVPWYRYHDAWLAARSRLATRETVWSWPVGRLAMPAAASDAAPRTLRARIVDARAVSADVRAYELEPEAGLFPPFEPGAHVDVHVAPGLVRPYSLCGSPADRARWRIAVKREDPGRGGSRAVHETFAAGLGIELGTPRNHFPLGVTAGRVHLVAGGIGLTPLLAMAEALHARGADFVLHVCARSAAALPFREELAAAPWAARVRIHLDDGAETQKLAAADLAPTGDEDEIYLCGPRPFMSWVIGVAESRGFAGERIHTESFVPAAVDPAGNRPFDAVLARTGRTLRVPAERSLLDVLQENRVAIAASCTHGVCGACATGVIDGEVDHRDSFFADGEKRSGRKMTPCVSRARGERLVLDL